MSNDELIINGWVARDKDGDLCLYRNKPIRDELVAGTGLCLWASHGQFSSLDASLFPSVTWDSEPLEVTITVKPTINNRKR